jgi:hypothetical protein
MGVQLNEDAMASYDSVQALRAANVEALREYDPLSATMFETIMPTYTTVISQALDSKNTPIDIAKALTPVVTAMVKEMIYSVVRYVQTSQQLSEDDTKTLTDHVIGGFLSHLDHELRENTEPALFIRAKDV